MIEAVKSYFFQNWILLLVIGAFVVTLFISSFSSKKNVVRLLALLLSIFILSVVVFIEFYLSPTPENRTPRIVLMAVRYSATPFILALVIMLLVKHQRLFVFIPAVLLLILNIVSIFTGIVFGLDNSENLARGPLGFVPYIVCGLYMAFLIVLLIIRSNKRKIEIVPIVFLAIALSSGLVFPFIFGAAFSQLFCTIIAVSLFIYYVFTILERSKKDALTDLLNRQAYYTETSRDYKDITAVVSVDMNGLKKINDTQGHAAGDDALMSLAFCIGRACRYRQSAYRMGGDEFIIICRKTSEEEVKELVKRIEDNVAETNCSCSIGYSYHKEGEISLKELVKESDERMYADKAEYYKNKK